MTQPPLPLWKVLFIDWHGVLSSDPFWASILRRRVRKGLRAALEQRLAEIFDQGQGLSDEWMKGRLTTSSLFAPVKESLTKREHPDFLERRIVHDCLNMPLDRNIVDLIRDHLGNLRVVLATDNTEDFEWAFHQARSARRRSVSAGPAAEATLRDIAHWFDGIICSSSRGVLKSEDPERFFGGWLEESGLTFADAMLVDDREDNCAAFSRAGGEAVVWDAANESRLCQAIARLEAWAGDGRPAPQHFAAQTFRAA